MVLIEQTDNSESSGSDAPYPSCKSPQATKVCDDKIDCEEGASVSSPPRISPPVTCPPYTGPPCISPQANNCEDRRVSAEKVTVSTEAILCDFIRALCKRRNNCQYVVQIPGLQERIDRTPPTHNLDLIAFRSLGQSIARMMPNANLALATPSEEENWGPPVINNLISNTFDEGSISWGRITSVLTYVGLLVEKAADNGCYDRAGEIVDWTVDYFQRHVDCWISEHGGWTGYRQHYATKRQPARLVNKLQREADGEHDEVKRILKTALLVGCIAVTGLYILDLLRGCDRK